MKRSSVFSCVVSVVAFFVFYAAPTYAVQPTLQNITTNVSEYAIDACHFRIASNIFGGNFSVHPNGESTVGTFYYPNRSSKNAAGLLNGFTLFCVDASDESIGTMLEAKQINGKWLSYNPWPRRNESELTPFDKGAHPQTVHIEGKNWSGKGLTVDATTGDEKRRARTFHFCLIHQTHALCGNTPVQWLADPSKRNDLDKMKAILQTVEFVDVPTPVESHSASGTATAPQD